MIKAGDYGPVRVIAGPHKGRTGYYDDDEMGLAVVYFDRPFTAYTPLIPRRSLERAPEHPSLVAFGRAYPDVAERLGVVLSRPHDSVLLAHRSTHGKD